MAQVISLLFHDVYRRNPSESGFADPVADRYKLTVANFGAAISAIADTEPRVVTVASNADLPSADRGVAVTADDGGLSYAAHVADVLESRGWAGHCFVTTDMIGRPGFLNAAELRDLDRRGHVIGSHSASHPTRFSACSWNQALEEWRRSRESLEDLLGHPVRVASLPGGYLSKRAARAAGEAGLDVLFTSEPVTRSWSVSGCTLLGRFAVRPGQSPRSVGAVAAGAPLPMARQWMTWRAKKVIKPVMGSLYPRVGAWVARYAR